MRRWWMVKLST